MRTALTLARKGGHVSPNPFVGCVVVNRERVVGRGHHKAYGAPHAEAMALKEAGSKARGATLYVTLEPCSHWGKTPPCSEAVIQAGVKRVVYAMKDPNPLVSGRGAAALRKAGLTLTRGILEKDAEELNRPFIKAMTQRKPYCVLKAALSLDGKISTARGDSQWISGPLSRSFGHKLRAQADAILVGTNTVIQDNPQLTSHGQGSNPLRVILDKKLRIPLTARVFHVREAQTLVATCVQPSHPKAKSLNRKGVRLVHLRRSKTGIDMKQLFQYLYDNRFHSILLEGGGSTNASCVEAGLVDEVCLFLAPLLLGGESAITFLEGRGAGLVRQAWKLKDATCERMGVDWLVRGKLCSPASSNN